MANEVMYKAVAIPAPAVLAAMIAEAKKQTGKKEFTAAEDKAFTANFIAENFGKIPMTAEEVAALKPSVTQQRIIDIKLRFNAIYAELDNIDTKSIRAIRSADTARMQSLENDAVALRQELSTLQQELTTLQQDEVTSS